MAETHGTPHPHGADNEIPLPCPFCGGVEVRVALLDEPGTASRHAWVHCRRCHAAGPSVTDPVPVTELDAVRQWNIRVLSTQKEPQHG